MKTHFKVICSLLCFLILACSVLTLAVGAEAVCSVTFEFTDAQQGALDGCTFRLYKIADGHLANHTYEDAYVGKATEMDELDWNSGEAVDSLASALSEHIASANVEPMTATVSDFEGKATFTGLEFGLYLALADEYEKDGWTYTTQPVLIWLPCSDGNDGYDYSPVCSPKHDKEPPEIITTEPPVTETEPPVTETEPPVTETEPPVTTTPPVTTPPTNNPPKPTPPSQDVPKLPQTGQLWWPVPILWGAGLFLLMLGVILVKTGKKKAPVDVDFEDDTEMFR